MQGLGYLSSIGKFVGCMAVLWTVFLIALVVWYTARTSGDKGASSDDAKPDAGSHG
jgi:hypothetical protein